MSNQGVDAAFGPPLDLTPCPGCGFGSSGVTAGCVDCCKRNPERFAEMSSELSAMGDEAREALGRTSAELAAYRLAFGAGQQYLTRLADLGAPLDLLGAVTGMRDVIRQVLEESGVRP